MKARRCAAEKGLALVLSLAVGVAPLTSFAQVESGDVAETFTFGEAAQPIAKSLVTTGKGNAAKFRTAPVSSSGAFLHEIPIDLPPGRGGMTPSLALTYSSDAFRKDSPVGAGWSFGPPAITRSTVHGFPLLKGRGFALTYDDDRATFEGPDGLMAAASTGPTGAQGRLYAPLREHSPVRYEYVTEGAPPGGLWIQHSPDGVKRYFGGDPEGNRAQVVNELGTHAWLLLMEVDPNGNHVAYRYHHIDEQARSDLLRAQAAPVLARVEWGGNRLTGKPHLFSVDVQVRPYTGDLDMLHGHVALTSKITSIRVGRIGAASPYWTYTLTTTPSAFTGRLLLTRATRTSAGEAATTKREIILQYSGRGPSFAPPSNLPATDAYSQTDIRFCETGGCNLAQVNHSSKENALTPPDLRSAHKFLDFDGDGDGDIIYHPVGLSSPASRLLYRRSFLQEPATSVTSSSFNFGRLGTGDGAAFGISDFELLADLADTDGDVDLDGVVFPVEILDRDGTGLPHLDVSGEDTCADTCCNASFWNDCGNVDPVPDFRHWELGHEVMFGDLASAPGMPPMGTEASVFSTPPVNPINCLTLVEACHTARIPRPVYGSGLPEGGDPDPSLPPDLPEQVGWAGVPQASEEMTMKVLRNVGVNSDRAGAVGYDLALWPRDVKKRVTITKRDTPDPILGMVTKFFPRVSSDFLGPMADVNADGRADLVLLKYINTPSTGGRTFQFVPRAYLSREEAYNLDWDTGTDTGSAFTASLLDVLIGDPFSTSPRYPCAVNFNAMLVDVNADGLPDLMVATPPALTSDGQFLCGAGHEVFLNRGYRWEKAGETSSSTHRWAPAGPRDLDHPLSQILNRMSRCGGEGTIEVQPDLTICFAEFRLGNVCINLLTGEESQASGNVLLPATSIADVNADGRVDFVIAYGSLAPGRGVVRRIFLNTGSGFAPAEQLGFTDSFPAETFFAVEPVAGWQSYRAPLLGDTARLVDLDSDGLSDLVTAGRTALIGPFVEARPAQWYQNRGEVPDLLSSVDSQGGSRIAVSYVAATSAEARKSGVIAGDQGQLSPGQMVVQRVERAAGPESAADDRDYPVETIRLSYENFVRDFAATETIGFERIVATFENRDPAGMPAGAVSVSRRFDVRETVPSFDPAAFPSSLVRFPLKGVEREVVATDGTSLVQHTSEPAVWAGGESARIRERNVVTTDCLLDANGHVIAPSCRAAQSSSGNFDEFGNARSAVMGNSDGTQVLQDAERLESVLAFENRSGIWRLGLPSSQQDFGSTENISGQQTLDALLSDQAWTYDSRGRLETETRVGITPLACAGTPASDTTTYTYNDDGTVQTIAENGRRTVRMFYDADNLYVANRFVDVRVYSQGRITPALRTLEESYTTDVRHGQVTSVTDFNGKTRVTDYDSFGRALVEYGPDGVLLASHVYTDTFPAQLHSTIHSDDAKTYERVTYLDGAGRAIAEVERDLLNGTVVRKSYIEYDAWGRDVASYLPRFATSVTDTGVLATEPWPKVTEYDGFDRPVMVVLPDGRITRTSYEPQAKTEINPKLASSRQDLNWRGDVVAVSKTDRFGAPLGTYMYRRDAIGRLVAIQDPDGLTRNLERDLGGRVHRADLPRAGVGSEHFVLCHDLDDEVVGVVTPEGREAAIARDELGRPHHLAATLATGVAETFLAYDDAARLALGRLSRLDDDSGVWQFSYDAFGRQNRIDYAVAAGLAAGLPGQSFYADFDYARQGNLRSVTVGGAGDSARFVYVRDGRGRVRSVVNETASGTATLSSNILYDAQERMRGAGFGNGTGSEWVYDPVSQFLTDLVYRDNDGAQFAAVRYRDFDETGNVRSESREAAPGTVRSAKAHTFDALDRLSWSSLAIDELGLVRSEVFAYSDGGNIMSAGGESYAYNDPRHGQAATGLGARSMSYDADGQLVGDVLADGRTRALSYDAAGCLRSVTETSDTGALLSETTNICGQGGRRVYRQSFDAVSNTTSRVVDFAGIAEIRPDDGVMLVRVPINETVLVEQALDLGTGALVVEESGYLHLDMRQSVLARTSFDDPSPASAVVETHEAEYEAWGGTVDFAQLPLPTHRFVNHEPDPGLGYYHFGRRVYDPSLRRWLSPDPLVFSAPEVDSDRARESNLYAYARSNPVRLTDVGGDWAQEPTRVEQILGIQSGTMLGLVGSPLRPSAPVGTSPHGAAIGALLVLAAATAGNVANLFTSGTQPGGTAPAAAAAPGSAASSTTEGATPGVPAGTAGSGGGSQEPPGSAAASPAPDPGGGKGDKGGDPGGGGKKAADSGKNERHGDRGRALDKAQKQIKDLKERAAKAKGTEKKRIEKKIQRIRETAQKKKRGEEHSRQPKK